MPSAELKPLEDIDVMNWSFHLPKSPEVQFLFAPAIPRSHREWVEYFDEEKRKGAMLWSVHALAWAGVCGLYDPKPVYRSWELRIVMLHDTGKGYGTDAVRQLLQRAFIGLNAHRVWLQVNLANRRAIACYQKCGFLIDGIDREALWVQGAYRDVMRMSVLEGEYKP